MHEQLREVFAQTTFTLGGGGLGVDFQFAQNCRKFDSQFRTILCKYPFPMPTSEIHKWRELSGGASQGSLHGFAGLMAQRCASVSNFGACDSNRANSSLGKSFHFKNLLMPLFLMGCFPVDFQEVKRPLRTKSAKRPIKVGKRPINEGKRPIKAMVLVGISVGCLMGCFRAAPPWQNTAPLKRPMKRSMIISRSRVLRVNSGVSPKACD